MDILRLFVALTLPEQLLNKIGDVQRALERRCPPSSVRWVQPHSIHLTLKFLGETPAARLSELRRGLSNAAEQSVVFHYTIGGLGCFPGLRRPRVVWVGLEEPSGRLAALQRAVEGAVARLGYPSDGRPFQPHLTLGRVREHVSSADLSALSAALSAATIGQLGEAFADHFVLMQSVLKPSGAEYAVLATFPLGQPPSSEDS